MSSDLKRCIYCGCIVFKSYDDFSNVNRENARYGTKNDQFDLEIKCRKCNNFLWFKRDKKIIAETLDKGIKKEYNKMDKVT